MASVASSAITTSAATALSGRSLSTEQFQLMLKADNSDPHAFVNKLNSYLASDKFNKLLLRQKLTSLRLFNCWTTNGMIEFVKWAEDPVNKENVDVLMRAEFPDAFPDDGQRIHQDKVRAYLSEFVALPLARHLVAFQYETLLGKEVYRRAFNEHQRRKDVVANDPRNGLATCRSLEVVDTVVSLSALLKDTKVFHQLPPASDRSLYHPHYVHFFQRQAALCLGGFRPNGTRSFDPHKDCLSPPARAVLVLAECDEKLWLKREKLREKPSDHKYQSIKRANSNGRIGRKTRQKLPFDIVLDTKDVEECVARADQLFAQFKLQQEEKSASYGLTLDPFTQQPLLAIEEEEEGTFDQPMPDDLDEEEPGDPDGTKNPTKSQVPLPTKLAPMPLDAVLRGLFPAIRDGSKNVNDKERHFLDPDPQIVECENFQKGDLDVMTEAIASCIVSDFINEKGVALDELLACGPRMRQLLGLPASPKKRYCRYHIEPHQWLTETDRKTPVVRKLREEEGDDGTPMLLNALSIIQQNDLLSWDMKDAILLISSEQWFDRDESKGGESCIRAAVIGMDDSAEFPYFSVGKGKAVLAQNASIADIASITIANEFVNWIRAVQNDVARMICFGEKDSSMFKWHDFYRQAPSYKDHLGSHTDDELLAASIDQMSIADATQGPPQEFDRAGAPASAKRIRSPSTKSPNPTHRRRLHSPQKTAGSVGDMSMEEGISPQSASASPSVLTKREEELEELYLDHFFIAGDGRHDTEELSESQAKAYGAIRNWCTVIHGIPPQCHALERYIGNAIIQRAGPGADYGPHTDTKPTLNQTASHPNKTLSDGSLLPTRQRFPVFTFTTSLRGACAETLVLHGQFGGSNDKPCTCVQTSANDGHYQPDGAQVAGKHKGQPSPNRPIYKPLPPDLCPDLPEEFLKRWLPKGIPRDQLRMENARFVTTVRKTPLGGKDLGVYATGYLLEKLDASSTVYNHHCYSQIAFGRKKNPHMLPTEDWHAIRGREYFQDAVREYEAAAASHNSSAAVTNAAIVDVPQTLVEQIDVKEFASHPKLGHQRKVENRLWALCHRPAVRYEEVLKFLPDSSHSHEMPGIPVPQKTIRMSDNSLAMSLNAATTQIMLRDRVALSIMEDDGLTKTSGPAPLFLHPDRKIPVGLGAIITGDELDMKFKDLSNDILERQLLNQTANHRYYKQDEPDRTDIQICYARLVARWDKLVREKKCVSKFDCSQSHLAGKEPRIDILSTLEELVEECENEMRILENRSQQQVESAETSIPRGRTASEEMRGVPKAAVVRIWKRMNPLLSNEKIEDLWKATTEAEAGPLHSAATLLMPPLPCKDMEDLVDSLVERKNAFQQQHPQTEWNEYSDYALKILQLEQRHLPIESPKLTEQQIKALVDMHSIEVCSLAIDASVERKRHRRMLQECEPAERLLYTIYAAMGDDPLTQIGSSGSATLEGANSMSHSSSSPDDSHVKSAQAQPANAGVNACFSKLTEMGNAVAHFVNLDQWMAIPRDRPTLSDLPVSADYSNKFMCIGYWRYDHIQNNVRLEAAQCWAAFRNSQRYVKSNSNFMSFMSSGYRKHYLKWAINFPTILKFTSDWNDENAPAYNIVPVNNGNVGPSFGVGDVLSARKLDSSRLLASRVLSKTEFGKDEWLCSHNSSADLIWTMFKDKPLSLLQALGALPPDELDDARKNGSRQTASKLSLRKYAFSARELCSMSANVMGAAALRATKKCYLPTSRPNVITPLPLVCPGSEKLVPVVREGPMPCPVPSVDVARCFMRSEVNKTLDVLDPNHTHFAPKWVKLDRLYYKSEEELKVIEDKKQPGLREFYEAMREYMPEAGRTMPGVYEPFVRGLAGWETAADILTDAIYKAILFRTSGKVTFLMTFPKFKEKLAMRAGVSDHNTPDCLPPRKEAKIYCHYLKQCQSKLGFVMSNIQSDQHDKQIPEEWKGTAEAFLDYCDFALSLATSSNGIEKVRLYLRSVLAPKQVTPAQEAGLSEEANSATEAAEFSSSPDDISRLKLRSVIASAIASCSDLSPSASNLKFLSHQAIGDVEASIPGFAGEVTPDSVAPAFGGDFGLRICNRGMQELKKKTKSQRNVGSAFCNMLVFVHGESEVRMKEDVLEDPAFLALQGYGLSVEGHLIDLRTGDFYTYSHTEHRCCKGYICCARAHSSRTGSEQPDNTSLCCHPVPGYPDELKFLEADNAFFKLLCHALDAVPRERLLKDYPNVHYPKPVWHGDDQTPFTADWLQQAEGQATPHDPLGMHLNWAGGADVSALETSGIGSFVDESDEHALDINQEELEAEAQGGLFGDLEPYLELLANAIVDEMEDEGYL